jgi:hypothetical protein
VENGYKFTPMKEGQPNPYPTSKHMLDDLYNNKHLHYYPTEQGYGSNGAVSDHPMLQTTNINYNNKPMLANNLFRVVHYVMGHGLYGNGFGANGEQKAYEAHKQLYSPIAQKALAAETKGQSSTVNFGKHALHNKTNPQNTIYADQKAVVAPDWVIHGETPLGKSELEKSDTPLYHYSTQNGLTHIDPNFQGTGAPSEENRQGVPEIKRSYYYTKDEPEDIVKQQAKTKYVAHMPSDHRIYDIAADKDQLIPKLKQESMKRQVNQGVVSSEDYLKAIKDAGYHGYHNPSSQIPHALAMFYPLQVHKEFPLNNQ